MAAYWDDAVFAWDDSRAAWDDTTTPRVFPQGRTDTPIRNKGGTPIINRQQRVVLKQKEDTYLK